MTLLNRFFSFLLLIVFVSILISSSAIAEYLYIDKNKTIFIINEKENYNNLVKLDEIKKVDDIKKEVSKEYTDLKAEYTAKQLEKTTVLKTELEKQKCYTLTTDKDKNLVLEISPEGDICSSEKEWAKFFESKEWKEWSGQ